MRKYSAYKPSGIEWIGEIPEHWKVKKLKYLITNNDGGVWGNDGGNLYVLRSTEINVDGSWNYENEPAKRDLSDSEFSKSILKESDLLITKSSGSELHIGKTGLVNRKIADMKCCFSNFMQRIRPKNNQNSNLLFHYLNSNLAREQYNYLSNTTTGLANLSAEIIANVLVPNPPTLDEQIAIANYLDKKTAKIDELIKQKEKLLLLFEEDKIGIINNAVTKGINSEVKLKDSEIEWLGLIPEHWKVKRFKYLGKFINGFSFNSSDFVNSGIRVIKISNIQTMTLDWSDESFVEDVFYDNYPSFRVYENDLVFALTRPIISTGIKAAIVNSSEKLLLNQRNSMFRVTSAVNTRWMYYLVLSKNFIQEFDKQIDKTGQQPNISSNDIAEIYVPVPEINEQLSVINYLDNECKRIDEIKNKIKIQIEVFKEYKTALISEVATGKVKVI